MKHYKNGFSLLLVVMLALVLVPGVAAQDGGEEDENAPEVFTVENEITDGVPSVIIPLEEVESGNWIMLDVESEDQETLDLVVDVLVDGEYFTGSDDRWYGLYNPYVGLFELPEGETFELEVYAYDGLATGLFTVEITLYEDLEPEAIDPALFVAGAIDSEITLGLDGISSVEGEIEEFDTVLMYTLVLNTDAAVDLLTTSDYDTSMILADEMGEFVDANDDLNTESLLAGLEGIELEAGTYYVYVGIYAGDVGDFMLNVSGTEIDLSDESSEEGSSEEDSGDETSSGTGSEGDREARDR